MQNLNLKLGIILSVFFFNYSVAQKLKNYTSTEIDYENYPSPSIESIKPITIGEKVPNIFLGQVINHAKVTSANVIDFKGKLLILDFWSTRCTNCIASFPKLESLQSKFGNKLMILPIGFDVKRKEEIKQFITNRKGTFKQFNLPTAVQNIGDTILSTYFPFSGMPHVIWIDSTGTLIGITSGNALTEKNISKVLNGEKPNFSPYRLKYKYISCEPFLLHTSSPQFEYKISGYIDSLKSAASFDLQCDSNYLRLFEVNASLFRIYRHLYNEKYNLIGRNSIGGGDQNFMNKTIKIEIQNNSFYKDWESLKNADNFETEHFMKQNLFCYEAKFPKEYGLIRAYNHMINVLDSSFNISSSYEPRIENCLILVRTSSKNLLKSSNTSKRDDCDFEYLTKSKLRSLPFKNLVGHLNVLLKEIIVLDETGFEENMTVDMDINVPALDIENIRKELNRYDLDLVQAKRSINCLVFRNR